MSDIEKYQKGADAYRKMNITEKQRIGWDIKQEYQDRLAELSSDGYLSAEEYEARKLWVEGSVTKQQLDMAFTDLPVIPYHDYTEKYPVLPHHEKQVKGTAIPGSVFVAALLEIVVAAANYTAGQWIVGSVFAILALLTTIIAYRETKG